MGRFKKKINDDMGDYIRKNPQKTVNELAQDLHIAPSKVYYYVSKNNIPVKKNKSSVEKFLENL